MLSPPRYPAQRNVVALLIPGGLEGRVMGLYQFASISLAWAPPLLFAAIYEATASMRVGIATSAAFHAASLLVVLLRLDLDAGHAAIKTTLSKRRGSAFEVTGAHFSRVEPEGDGDGDGAEDDDGGGAAPSRFANVRDSLRVAKETKR